MDKILIIDDDKSICIAMKMILDYESYQVSFAFDAFEGLKKVREEKFSVIFLDIKMPGKDGLEALSEIKEIDNTVSVIMISGHATIENAIEATKKGAFDFILKPMEMDRLVIAARNAVNNTNLLLNNKIYNEKFDNQSKIIGESEQIRNIFSLTERVAATNSRVLITGENGTGKELVAKEIHRLSNRSKKPFIEVNCASLPNELIESELFGHEKGAFTGATSQRIGKFEQANTGTIFLDEIGDMSLNAQAKVLRCIENNQFERVGGTKNINVDVRLISATNKDLLQDISENKFREDLYHRLNVIPIHIPPLRERKEDIILLINYFTIKICEENFLKIKEFSKEAIEFLKYQPWNGNIRELRNFIERIIIINPKEYYTLKDVQKLMGVRTKAKSEFDFYIDSFQDFKDTSEKVFLKKKLKQYDWNISKTADIIGIQRSHLYNKIKKYGLEKEQNE